MYGNLYMHDVYEAVKMVQYRLKFEYVIVTY